MNEPAPSGAPLQVVLTWVGSHPVFHSGWKEGLELHAVLDSPGQQFAFLVEGAFPLDDLLLEMHNPIRSLCVGVLNDLKFHKRHYFLKLRKTLILKIA